MLPEEDRVIDTCWRPVFTWPEYLNMYVGYINTEAERKRRARLHIYFLSWNVSGHGLTAFCFVHFIYRKILEKRHVCLQEDSQKPTPTLSCHAIYLFTKFHIFQEYWCNRNFTPLWKISPAFWGKIQLTPLDSGQLISKEGQTRLLQSGLRMGKLTKRIFCLNVY